MSYRLLSANLYDIYYCSVYSKKTPDDWQRNCPKHVEFHSKNKFEKLVHLVGFIIRNSRACSYKISPPPPFWKVTVHNHTSKIARTDSIVTELTPAPAYPACFKYSSLLVGFLKVPFSSGFQTIHYVLFSAYFVRAVRLVDHMLMNYTLLIIFRTPTSQNVPQCFIYSSIIYFSLG